MKILLIQPAKAANTIGGEDLFILEPLALEYIAAGVVSDHEVYIIDLRLEKNLKNVFDEFKPDIVGITSYTVNVNTVKELFKDIKSWNSKVFTVVGGHHATVAPEDFLQPEIDLIVMGEGVYVFKEVVSRIEKEISLDGIQGMSCSEKGKIIKSSQQLIDLDAFPLPARNLTMKYRKHYYSEWMKPLASIRTSKGCPFRCNFCALWKLNGGTYQTRKPENILKELSEINEKYVFFADDESLLDTKRMTELATLIEKSGIKKRYFLYGRSDTIVKHPDLIKKWKGIGLERILIGLESYKDDDLISIGKKSTVQINNEAIRILQDLAIEVYASFIIKPEFIKKDFNRFIAYCRKLNLSFATFSVLTPLPGTDLYEELKDKLVIRNYDYFDFLHSLLPTRLPSKEFYNEMYFLFRRSISIMNRFLFLMRYPIREMPKVLISSNHTMKKIKNAYKS